MTTDKAKLVELAKQLYGGYTKRRVMGPAFDQRVREITELYCTTNRIHPTDIDSTVHIVVKHFEYNYYQHFQKHPDDDYVVFDETILKKVGDFLEDER